LNKSKILKIDNEKRNKISYNFIIEMGPKKAKKDAGVDENADKV
jgi:hypothetical protein